MAIHWLVSGRCTNGKESVCCKGKLPTMVSSGGSFSLGIVALIMPKEKKKIFFPLPIPGTETFQKYKLWAYLSLQFLIVGKYDSSTMIIRKKSSRDKIKFSN